MCFGSCAAPVLREGLAQLTSLLQYPRRQALAALKPACLVTQVPGPVVRLRDLPMEVLGIICRQLSLRDRWGVDSMPSAALT